jgi:hypothetical protein
MDKNGCQKKNENLYRQAYFRRVSGVQSSTSLVGRPRDGFHLDIARKPG